MLFFCTYFDIRYIHRGLALYESMKRQKEPFTLWILCFDEETWHTLSRLKLPEVRLIRNLEFEDNDEELKRAKTNRSRVEYYWTCTPSLPLFIFRRFTEVDVLTYIDSDMYFYSSLGTPVTEMGSGSVLINLQDISADYEGRGSSGKYNVGVVTFRGDQNGKRCLEWWREQCLQSCFYRPEEGLYGDQHFLDDWPERFEKVVVSSAVGLRAAPWNISKYAVTAGQKGTISVGGHELICFHFHALRFCNAHLVFLIGWNVRLSPACSRLIYRPYVEALLKAERTIRAIDDKLVLPKSGIPWRYVAGRLIRRQPLRNFMWVGGSRGNK